MAKVEVDETELGNLRTVFNAVRAGLANPKTRTKLMEVQAELEPASAAAMPELTLRGALDEFKAEIRSELTKFVEESSKEKTDREERDQRAKLEERWTNGRKVARDAGYTAEGLEKLEKFMEDEGIANHTHAIPAFERLNPPPQPVATGGQRWDFFGAKEDRPPNLQALIDGNDDAWLADAIPNALKTARGQ